MRILRNKSTATITFVLMITIAAALLTCVPVNSIAGGHVTAAVAVSPKIIGIGQSVLINGWIEPMPDIGWIYANITVDITPPSGAVVTLGPFFSFGSGTIFTIYTPPAIGSYSAVLRWPGGNNTADYDFNHVHPLAPYITNVASPAYTFTVQQEAPPAYQDQPLPGPNDFWKRPVSSEFRLWSAITGSYLYSGGFGDSWRTDNLGNKHINPYALAPKTPHVAWTFDWMPTGIVGGEKDSETLGTTPGIDIIIGGVGYYQRNGLHAVDMRTGEELWVNTAMTDSITFAQLPTKFYSSESATGFGGGESFTPPRLWSVGTTNIRVYDARTGALLTTYAGPGGFQPDPTIPPVGGARATAVDFDRPDGGVLLYQTYSGSTTLNATWITCWNSSKPGTTFASKLAWYATDIIAESGSGPYVIPGKVVVLARSGNPNLKAYNALTGALLWDIRTDQLPGVSPFRIMSEGGIDGKNMRLYYPCSTDMRVRAFNVNTGAIVWTSEPRMFPWGAWSAYSAAVWEDKFYVNSYDGVYCYNALTGAVVWKYIENTTETPYGTYSFYGRPYIAGRQGLLYTQQYEHSPTTPLYRGQKIFCFDAKTGDVIWTFSMQGTGMAGADGVVTTVDAYTGIRFGFGKGETKATVTVSDPVIAKGDSVLIEGTIMDQSPAQPDTPCVSTADMRAWMEHLHLNKPAPLTMTGVDVMLQAISGTNVTNIATVRSDASGKFKYLWTPPDQKVYTIAAYFVGDDAYWPSYDATGLGVTAAPASPPEPEPVVQTDYTPMLAGTMVGVIIAIVIGLVSLFWKRK